MAGQNTSSAVMAQRREPRDALDDFPTHPFAVRALVEDVLAGLVGGLDALAGMTVAEPACNRGYMARTLGEYCARVEAADIADYGYVHAAQADYLADGTLFAVDSPPADLTVTNPPFVKAAEFIERALVRSRVGIAMFARTVFLEGADRYERLFSVRPPTVIAQHVDRVSLVQGRVDPDVSSATAYLWLVWIHGVDPLPFRWIAPARQRLARPGDYVMPDNRYTVFRVGAWRPDGAATGGLIAAASDLSAAQEAAAQMPGWEIAIEPSGDPFDAMVALQRLGRLWLPDPATGGAAGGDWRQADTARALGWVEIAAQGGGAVKEEDAPCSGS